jgi:putative nucleotidyltransferase with HDIG domain
MGPPEVEPQKIELVLAQLESLPPLAPVAARILALTEDSRSSAGQIIELIGSDPSLTMRVLSLLNRADRGVRPEAVTIQNAVVLLGFKTIRQVTLAVKVMEVFGGLEAGADADAGVDRVEFWKHCLAVACAARRIAMHLRGHRVEAEEAFVLGLLHDVGKIGMRAAMPKSFAKVVRRASEVRGDVLEVERAILGVDHTLVGRRLAERWNLPRPLIETIWLHHQPLDGLPPSIAAGGHVQIVHLADTLVREQRIGYSGNYQFLATSRELAERLCLPESERIAIVESLAEEIEARAEWIGAEEISSREVYVRSLTQITEELSEANVALTEKNRLLERKTEYFAALSWLNHAVSSTASRREVCAASAEALRRALSLKATLIVHEAEEDRWAEIGLADGHMRGELVERQPPQTEEGAELEAAVRLAMAGTWITPAGRAFDWLIGRYRSMLGPATVWLVPIVRERRWIAGGLFAAEAEQVGGLRGESAQIEALSAALGLAIDQAHARTEAMALSDELVAVNRRMSAMQAELVESRALGTVVAMAAGAAHELNNPLAVISGRAQILRGTVQDEAARQALELIAKQAQACSDIVTELLEFANPRPAAPESINLPALLGAMRAELIRSGLLEESAISVETASDRLLVWFDPDQLRGVLREIIENSVEATAPSSRRLTVKIAADLAEKRIVVEVRDNGRGMSSEVLARAADPFFSQRPAGRGRGLGLARAQRWLRLNGATMRIRSRAGEGTVVELRLPVA